MGLLRSRQCFDSLLHHRYDALVPMGPLLLLILRRMVRVRSEVILPVGTYKGTLG